LRGALEVAVEGIGDGEKGGWLASLQKRAYDPKSKLLAVNRLLIAIKVR
jgi:hypothetical protein